MKNDPNAGRKTMSDIMSDPQYLRESLRRRRDLEQQQEMARKMMGIRNPKRAANLAEHAGFAEGALGADDGQPPAKELPITNPRFKR